MVLLQELLPGLLPELLLLEVLLEVLPELLPELLLELLPELPQVQQLLLLFHQINTFKHLYKYWPLAEFNP